MCHLLSARPDAVTLPPTPTFIAFLPAFTGSSLPVIWSWKYLDFWNMCVMWGGQHATCFSWECCAPYRYPVAAVSDSQHHIASAVSFP